MNSPRFDVVAVGNAIVDVIQPVSEAFLVAEGIAKNAMTLIDEERADYLTSLFTSAVIAAGGSAANTATGVASLGGSAAYLGKVADDALGARFAKESRAAGVMFDTPPLKAPPGTARSLIAVTPDGHRSMNTYLGASSLLAPPDIDRATVEAANVVFLEGYLFDRDAAKAAFVHAAEIAHAAGRKVSLTLSDLFCVDRHRESFLQLVRHHVDILFANEMEILALYQTNQLETAFEQAEADCDLVAVTRSEAGSVILAHGERTPIAPYPVERVVDSTGAGDLYAAGFLFGHARGLPLAQCGALASLAAAEVISHMGPRPETNLRDLALSAGLAI